MLKTIKLPNETFEFLAWLVRQDVTLPNVIVEYLKPILDMKQFPELNKKTAGYQRFFVSGRGGRIRTDGLCNPIATR